MPADDPNALSSAIVGALDDPEARSAWAERARSTVREFGVERMVDRTLAVYRAVCVERSGSGGQD